MACPSPLRQSLMNQFLKLAANPRMKGQRSVRDLSGREHQVLEVGTWEVTYWADHAVRELRIVRLRKIFK